VAIICMKELLAWWGEAHLVSRGQISGRCIHHAGGAPSSAVHAIAVSMIESPFGTLLVLPSGHALLLSADCRGTRTRAIAPAPAAATADHEAATTTRAISLDADPDHRRPTPKSWMRPRPPPIMRALALRISTNALAAPEGSERELRAFALLAQAIVTRAGLSRRVFGRARVPATPVMVGPDQAGGNRWDRGPASRRRLRYREGAEGR